MKRIEEANAKQQEAEKLASEAIVNETGIFSDPDPRTAPFGSLICETKVPVEYLPKYRTLKFLFNNPEDGEEMKVEICVEEALALLDGLKKIFEV